MTRLHPLVRCGLFVASYFLFAQVLGQGPIPAVMATVLMLAVCERRSFDFVGLSLGRPMFQLPGGLLIGGLMVSLLAAALTLSGQVKIEAGGFALALWAQWVLIFFVAAAGEELLFRGYGFQRLVEAIGPAATIGVLSLLFAVVHRNNPGASIAGLANTVVVGILLALAYLRTGNLWLPIGIHWGWNLAEASWGFPVSGITIEGMPLKAIPAGQPLFTGGTYGPEASIAATLVIAAGIVGLLISRVRGADRDHAK